MASFKSFYITLIAIACVMLIFSILEEKGIVSIKVPLVLSIPFPIVATASLIFKIEPYWLTIVFLLGWIIWFSYGWLVLRKEKKDGQKKAMSKKEDGS